MSRRVLAERGGAVANPGARGGLGMPWNCDAPHYDRVPTPMPHLARVLLPGLVLGLFWSACAKPPAATLQPSRTELQLFADYHQLYLQDEGVQLDAQGAASLWSEASVERMFATAPGVVAIGTLRNVTVPVVVEIRGSAPELALTKWDHVVEGGLRTRSPRVAVFGCTDDRAKAKRIPLPPGEYRVRLAVSGAQTVAPDGLSGQDAYEITVWPGGGDQVVVHKQRRR